MSVVEDDLRRHIAEAVVARAASNGGWVSRAELSRLTLDGRHFRVIDQSGGIWNPSWLSSTLAIISDPKGPYADRETSGGLFHYSYQAGSAEGRNKKLREAMRRQDPVILLRVIGTSTYVPVYPVYVIADLAAEREFVLALDDSVRFLHDPMNMSPDQRRYAERVVRQRLHQPEFRGRVIRAYSRRCTVCLLKHPDLLDAAHIIGDTDDGGDPVVTNGLSMCKIHHAAYDRQLLGISPDYVVEINHELMEEVDGPMLRHGLQEMNGRRLELPGRRVDWPDRERLAARFEAFSAAS